jgi:acyl-CoA hydrolase
MDGIVWGSCINLIVINKSNFIINKGKLRTIISQSILGRLHHIRWCHSIHYTSMDKQEVRNNDLKKKVLDLIQKRYHSVLTVLQIFKPLWNPIQWRLSPLWSSMIPFSKEPEITSNLKIKTPSESFVELTEMLMPSQADTRGYAYGGVILSWVDICGGIASYRHAGQISVTASLDVIHFVSPARVGDVILIRGQVNRAWRTSMEVGVHVEAENMLTGERRYCCHAYMTFVAVNKDSKPTSVPQTLPVTDIDRKRYEEAEKRKSGRLELRQQHEERLDRVKDPNFDVHTFLPEAIFDEKEKDISWRYCSDTYTEMFKIILPQHANIFNITFGGVIMQWIEECAIIAASRHCRSYLLTANIDSMHFFTSTKVGNAIHLRAYVSHAFNTSVEVYVRVTTNNHMSEKIFTNDAYLTITAVNQHNEPIKVPRVRPITQEEIVQYVGAPERRQVRLRSRNEHKRILSSD